MNETFMILLIGMTVPLFGTVLGSSTVFLFKNQVNKKVSQIFLGFAAGVMIAAAVWSLLIPAIDMTRESGGVLPVWFPAAAGFLAGIGFFLLLDFLIPHFHINNGGDEGVRTSLKKSSKLMLAITLHNIPEGMTVGVVLVGALSGSNSITIASAIAISIGLAIQNILEGAAISIPLMGVGIRRSKAFAYGSMTGVVEPVAAVITIALASLITPILPYILAFSAGAMFYVVIEELIPGAQSDKHNNAGTVSAAFGFVLMMILDIALS